MLLILLMGCFVSAVDVDLDCPDEVFVGESFECDVEVSDGDEVYDLKVEIDEERDSVLKIWNSGAWKSSYYYLKEFIRDDAEVRLKIEEVGKFDMVVKLRNGDWREEFDCGRIRVEEGEIEEDESFGSVENNGTRINADDADFVEEGGVIVLNGKDDVLVLNSVEVEDEWDYVSKDGKVVDWLPYLFCLFLICLVGVLGWDKGRKY